MRLNKLLSEILGEEHLITPSEFLNPPLRKSFLGGYRKSDVDAFLKRAADAMETLISEVKELRTETERQKDRLEEYRQMETTLRNALVSSQEFSENIIAAAKREANLIREEALLQKDKILSEATQLPAQIAAKIAELEHQKTRLRDEILTLIETHRKLLDTIVPPESIEKPSALFEPPSYTDNAGREHIPIHSEAPQPPPEESSEQNKSVNDVANTVETDTNTPKSESETTTVKPSLCFENYSQEAPTHASAAD